MDYLNLPFVHQQPGFQAGHTGMLKLVGGWFGTPLVGDQGDPSQHPLPGGYKTQAQPDSSTQSFNCSHRNKTQEPPVSNSLYTSCARLYALPYRLKPWSDLWSLLPACLPAYLPSCLTACMPACMPCITSAWVPDP